MPRRRKIDPRELLGQLAREELAEAGKTVDHSGDFERWKRDPVAFINEAKLLPSDLHPQQVAILRMAYQFTDAETGQPLIKDLVVNKTRQVGMSWLWMAFELWLLLFHPRMRIINASRRFDEVDDGGSGASVRSLHGRILFMYEHRIPPWLKRRCPLAFKKGMISTKAGGFAHASTATPDVGRGGTYDMALLDEFAHVDWSRLVWAAISQACKQGKIANSTPKGRGNEFFQLWDNHQDRNVERIGYHWTDHPIFNVGTYTGADGEKRSPWYDAQCRSLGAIEMIAQELDMSFDRSVGARCYPEFDRRVHIGEVIRNEFTPLICAWDYGMAGSTAMILAQIERFADRTEIQVITCHEDQGLHIDAYVPMVGSWERLYGKMDHVGDPAGLARQITSGKGPIQALAEHGIYTASPSYLHRDAIFGIRLVRLALTGGRPQSTGLPVTIRIDPSCGRLHDSLENTHYPIDMQGNRMVGKEMPADNEWTHMSDAFRYLVHFVTRDMIGLSMDFDIEDHGAYTKGLMSKAF